MRWRPTLFGNVEALDADMEYLRRRILRREIDRDRRAKRL